MEIEQLDEAIGILQETIENFPVGAKTLDDFKPICEKIVATRESLKAINAKRLTFKAIIDSGTSSDLPESDLIKSCEKLNQSTTNYLINTKTLMLGYHSKAIQDILSKKAGSAEIQEKVKLCLNRLFIVNDQLSLKNEKKKVLMKKQYLMKLDCHHAIYDHQSFLKEIEARKNQQLEENNPNIAQYKEKINRSIFKICTMKKLVTNLIAAMCDRLYEDKELVIMLAKHKEMINLDTIIELTQNQN